MKKIYLMLLCMCGFGAGLFAQTTGGPDAYGYIWRTSDDPQGPTYSWIDTTSAWTEITGLTDDNSVPWITMQQPFHYYWSDYTKIKVGSNGWYSFNNIGNIAHCFPTIPTQGGAGDNFLAPFLTDLIFDAPGSNAKAYYYDDIANQRFVISVLDAPWWSAANPGYIGSNTFQVVLSQADSSITFQYKDVDQVNLNDQAGCAADLEIGIENVTGNIGLEVYNEIVPADSFAIKFYYPNPVTFQIPDITPAWSQNVDNKGQFYNSGGTISPQVMISSVGNADVTSDIYVVTEIRDINQTLVWSQNDTIFGGLTAASLQSITYSNIGPFAPGQYYVNTSTSSIDDINPSNDANTSEMVSVDQTANPIMMSFATQNPFMGTLAWTGGGGAGVYIKPSSYPLTMDSISAYIANAGLAEDFYIKVYDDDGAFDAPGTLLSSDTVLAGTYALDSWVMTPLAVPQVINSGGVYIAWEHISDLTIALGTETAGPISRQSWEFVGGSWGEYRMNDNTELMMNAYFSGICGNFTSNVDTVVNLSCFGADDGSIDISTAGGVGPFTFSWNNGSTDEDPTGLTPGNYTVTITDSQGCITTQTVSVTEPAELGLGALPSDEINGNDGSINLTVIGGTPPFTYNWDNGSTDEDPTGLAGGTYTVIVTDANGCSDTISVTVLSQVGIADLRNDFEFSIYPNPNDGNFSIALQRNLNEDYTVEVINALGQVAHTQSSKGQVVNVNLSNIESGIYFVRITADSGVSQQRIVVR